MIKVSINKKAIDAIVEKNVRQALVGIGTGLVKKIRNSMVPGTGKSYKIKNTIHIASMPGKPPSPFTYRLHDSITFQSNFGDKSNLGPSAQSGDGVGRPKRTMGGYVVTVGSKVPYALNLEIGNKKKGLAPRPYLWPALKGSRELIKEAFKY